MRVAGRCGVACLAIVIAALISTGCGSSGPPPAVGSAAIDFTLANQDGQPTSLATYRGKWVVLYFYPANLTESGVRHARQFQRDRAKYEQAHAVVIGISGGSVAGLKELATDEKLQTTLVSDADLAVSKQYGSIMRNHMMQRFAARNTFIINPDGKIAQVFLNADTKTNSEEVLRALSTLQQSPRPTASSESLRK
jgi:peroxiredoxin Q/BCP